MNTILLHFKHIRYSKKLLSNTSPEHNKYFKSTIRKYIKALCLLTTKRLITKTTRHTYNNAVQLLRPLNIQIGPLLRPLNIQIGPLLRPLNIQINPLLRPLNIQIDPLLRPLNIQIGPLLRPLNIQIDPLLRPLNIQISPLLRPLNILNGPLLRPPLFSPIHLISSF